MNKSHLSAYSPNEHLKQERLLRGWSQADVAASIGTDGYTVSRWERGRAQPSPYFRQKLCALFEKNAFDLGLLSLPSECPATISPPQTNDFPTCIPCSVPYPRNLCFTGRLEILQTLHSLLPTSRLEAPTQVIALAGLGGIGKTQIAIEYAYRYASEYTAIFWVQAETMESIVFSMLGIAKLLELPIEQKTDQQAIITAVQHWLATHGQWLLIWDNLDDLELPWHLSFPTRQGATLITTRRQTFGTRVRGLILEPMKPEEGMLFVLRRAKVLELESTDEQMRQLAKRRPGEYEVASKLLTTMGGLPLALDQVGAYIDESGCSLLNYLQLYQKQPTHLLDRRGIMKQDHPHSVAATFLLTYMHMKHEQGIAADVLSICTFMHTEAIPEEFFVVGARHLGLESVASNLSQFDQAISVLRNLSLLQRDPENHTLSIHCLVQAVLQGSMDEQERAAWVKRINAALNLAFPEALADRWKQGERLLPHVLAVANNYPDDAEDENLADILQKAAGYLRERAQHRRADTLYQRALHIKKPRSLEHSEKCKWSEKTDPDQSFEISAMV